MYFKKAISFYEPLSLSCTSRRRS